MSEKDIHSYGGQAVIEGVMIRGLQGVGIVVRRADNTLAKVYWPLSDVFTNRLRKIPLVRGILTLAESLTLGMRALAYSARISTENENTHEDGIDDTSNPEAISRSSMIGMILLSLTIAIIVFIVGPAILTSYLERLISSHLIVNVIEGILRLGMFIAYIAAISQMEDIKRVFMYHGAEHMTVHAKEHGDPLEISHIRRYPTAHPMCGTAFLLTLMLIAIIVFTFVGRERIWWLLTSRVILIPVIAAVSYEIIRFSGRYKNNLIVSSIALPSLWLQALTTRSPNDDQIEVAIAAMEEVIKHEA